MLRVSIFDNHTYGLFAQYLCACKQGRHRYSVQSVQHEVLTCHQQVGDRGAWRQHRHHRHVTVLAHSVCAALWREVVVAVGEGSGGVCLLNGIAQSRQLCFGKLDAQLGLLSL